MDIFQIKGQQWCGVIVCIEYHLVVVYAPTPTLDPFDKGDICLPRNVPDIHILCCNEKCTVRIGQCVLHEVMPNGQVRRFPHIAPGAASSNLNHVYRRQVLEFRGSAQVVDPYTGRRQNRLGRPIQILRQNLKGNMYRVYSLYNHSSTFVKESGCWSKNSAISAGLVHWGDSKATGNFLLKIVATSSEHIWPLSVQWGLKNFNLR